MSQSTAFLNLTLPELNEFVDSWNGPLNQNFEDIDDWCEDLYKSLVTSSATSTWSALRGSKSSLAARLNVSINADGTINVSGSSDIIDMATSAVRGIYSTPRDRLNAGDFETYDARQPVADGRFSPMAPGGPSAGYPPEAIDSGIALRSADFGVSSNEPIASPQRPWAPGLVTGGGSPAVSSPAEGQLQLNAAGFPMVFNIDGYIFRIREDILFDYSLIPGLLNNYYVWLYVERDDYNNAAFKYSEPGGTPATKDLRRLKSGSDGVTSTSTFTSASGTFDTAPFRVKEGDTLVITSGTAAGSYVIDALDGTTPNTKFTIKGKFKANVSGAVFYIEDNAMPNIGAAIAASNPDLSTSRPPFVAGRVYIGRAKHQVGGVATDVRTFTKGGVYDSGWISITDIASDFPLDRDHNLGAIPSTVDIWVRESSTARAYRPVVQRQVLTDPTDATKYATFLFPSMIHHCSETEITVVVLNESTSPAVGPSLFTDSGGTEKATGEIRIIARR